MDIKRIKKNWIISLILVLIFSFFTGYYISYRINEKEKSKLDIIQEIMENEWYYGIDDEDIASTLEEKMILGMLDLTKDPYTRYLTSLGTLADSYTGIGISVVKYGEYFIISEVSSQKAIDDGIKVGDILISINETSLKDKELNEINSLLPSVGNVEIKVIRNNQELTINTSVTTYEPVTVFTKEYGNVSYVKISEFNMDTASSLDAYFYNLDRNCTNLVLDLRGNPGGYVSSVREVLDLFVTSNKVAMSTVDKNGNVTTIKTVDDALYVFNKIVVLIDSMSASGAEALAAALNYHLDEIVTLYGETTYGKGSAQKTHYFSDGTYFHYTYALWNTPAGNTINHIGVDAEISDVNAGISSISIYDKELKLYDYGEEVLSIQKLLKTLNYYNGENHMFFDETLEQAIKDFQSSAPTSENLTINGKIDKKTLGYISKLIYDDSVDYLDNELQRVLGSMFA